MSHLTQAERDTLNAAMDIILAHTAPKASWSFGANYWHGSRSIGVTSYFSSANAQYTFLEGEKFSDLIEDGLSKQAHEDANKETAKSKRIAELKAELTSLGVASE